MDTESQADTLPALTPDDHKLIIHEGGELEGCEVGGVWYVAMARACRRLRLDWEGQRQKILRDPILSKGAFIMQAPSAGGSQETMFLRLDLFWGWLFKLELSRLAPDIAEQIMPLQRAGYQALHERFSAAGQAAPGALEALAERVARLEAAQATAHKPALPPARLYARVRRRELGSGAMLLAMHLRELGDAVPSQPELAALMGVEPRTVIRWLAQLREAGIIEAERHGKRLKYIVVKLTA